MRDIKVHKRADWHETLREKIICAPSDPKTMIFENSHSHANFFLGSVLDSGL
jgi:hypothetical protein